MAELNWVPIKNKNDYPSLIGFGNPDTNCWNSEKVLVQTKNGDMFIAEFWQSRYFDGDIESAWYSYGTGGRKMKVKGKVVAWAKVEPYVKE